MIPMLEIAQSLSNFAQNQNIFVFDFVVAMKACERKLYQMYCDKQTMYGKKKLNSF
jgi:hypothetical protein